MENEPSAAVVDPREIRVSDDDREHVGDLLQQAVGRGLLTIDEFDERMATAMAATTRGELNAVLVDLPGMHVRDAGHPGPVGPVQTLQNTMSDLNRTGVWTVPERLVVRGRFGNTVLNLSQAVLPGPVVTIEVDDVCGNTSIVLPPASTVDAGEFRVSMGSLTNSVVDAGPARLHLILRGRTRGGSVSIRTVRSGWGRRLLGA